MSTNPVRAAATPRSAETLEFTHDEHLSRQQAAERLVDIAYALTAGATLDLRTDGERLTVPVADEVLLQRRSSRDGERVDVRIHLSWSGLPTPAAHSNPATRD